eukprot:CAMPEP_0116145444 /NCGR_PEP_ID=MMETSP0329-20121206/16594_1 /TAXON_ID=697910 /ORGANISM="Pseudo-nitzschia arenysensis, Strain B593" /LENGTH=252 /DNA_ID=CAMNT_0003641045 /DNA_START=176 /DNA_END=937 /DNA_ORIENTATION=-
MVEFIELVKGTFRKFQLQAEVAVLDHDVAKRQKAFGIELYDLIEKQRVDTRAQIEKTMEENSTKEGTGDSASAPSSPAETVETFLKIFQTIENEIRGPLEACKADVDRMTEANYLPILIQKRKEDFGVQVWPIVSEPKWLHESLDGNVRAALAEQQTTSTTTTTTVNGETTTTTATREDPLNNFVSAAIKGVVKGTKTTITKAIGKLSPEQRELETMVKVAKDDIAVVEAQKTEKLTEIQDLVAGGTTLECC